MRPFVWRLRVVLAMTLLTGTPVFAQGRSVPVGVNVNSFQNFSAADQLAIVQELKRGGVRFVRTSLRPDDKNMALAKALQSGGIGLVVVAGPQFAPDTPPRPGDPKRHMRSADPLSAADPSRSRAYYQGLFDKLDANGVALAGVEAGNELNWTDFDGDFPIPGQGRAFTLEDLSRDPEARRVAQGFLQYLKVLAALKDVRDHSRLNRRAPIIAAGIAAVAGGYWQRNLQVDGVLTQAAGATYLFAAGDPGPIVSLAASLLVGSVLPPALPASDPGDDLESEFAGSVVQNCRDQS